MSVDYEARIAELEQQIEQMNVLFNKQVLDLAVHQAVVRKNFAALQEQNDTMLEMLKNHQKLHESHAASSAGLGRDIQRLNEVYYHVFPERLKPDVQFEEQLRALKPITDPDGKKPRT